MAVCAQGPCRTGRERSCGWCRVAAVDADAHPGAAAPERGPPSGLRLNLLAALGASLGVANIVLSWRLFGTGREGDLWMMVMAIAQALAILSQLGVEQVAVFSARARQAGADQGRRFDRDSLQWSLLFGLLFAVVMALMLQAVAAAFAAGFDAPTRDRLVALLLPIMLQLAAAPPLYVLR